MEEEKQGNYKSFQNKLFLYKIMYIYKKNIQRIYYYKIYYNIKLNSKNGKYFLENY